MTRNEETLLLFLTGLLLAFGISESTKQRKLRSQLQANERLNQELGAIWKDVGGYLRGATTHEGQEQERRAA